MKNNVSLQKIRKFVCMRHCYISRDYKNITSAGNKAKIDIEETMNRLGFVNIGLKRTIGGGVLKHFFNNLFGAIKAALVLKKGDVIVLQYPLKKYYEFICNVAHFKGAKVITQIHDLGSFRRHYLTPEQEVKRLAHSDVVIVHNENMKSWLEQQGCKTPLVVLGIFDYLSPKPITSVRPLPQIDEKSGYSMFFLGDLSPKVNKFAYDLSNILTNTKLYLYGNNFADELFNKDHGKYEGFAIDYEIMHLNKGDFGLSWYGESLNEGKGKIGEYMSYNNPHKVSLYIRCHVPVIISSTAGLAQFVKENNIGICIDSLEDLESELNKITLDDYKQMKDNVIKISDKIAAGYYFETAFNKALKLL